MFFLPLVPHNWRKICLDTPSSIHPSKQLYTMKAFCVEINTKLFHSPLLSATLSLLFYSHPPLIPFFTPGL